MTAKQEATKLVDKFYYRLYELQRNPEIELVMNQAKACALICVNEMLEEVINEDRSYWEEVKKEINK